MDSTLVEPTMEGKRWFSRQIQIVQKLPNECTKEKPFNRVGNNLLILWN